MKTQGMIGAYEVNQTVHEIHPEYDEEVNRSIAQKDTHEPKSVRLSERYMAGECMHKPGLNIALFKTDGSPQSE